VCNFNHQKANAWHTDQWNRSTENLGITPTQLGPSDFFYKGAKASSGERIEIVEKVFSANGTEVIAHLQAKKERKKISTQTSYLIQKIIHNGSQT